MVSRAGNREQAGVGRRVILATTDDEKGKAASMLSPARRGSWWSTRSLIVAALCIGLFVPLGVAVKAGHTLVLDRRAHRVVRGPEPAALDEDSPSLRTRLMYLGPDIGTATVVVAPLTALALIGLRRRRAACGVAASVAGALCCALVLKLIFQRTRSGHGWGFDPRHVFGYLFPSTHIVLTIVTYGTVAALVAARLRGWRRAAVFITFLLLLAFVSYSLIYLNTHYLTDVLGGLLVGTAWLAVFVPVLHMLERTSAAGTAVWGDRRP